jgi:hypothetical protein
MAVIGQQGGGNNIAAEYVNSVMADLKPFWVIVLRQAIDFNLK